MTLKPEGPYIPARSGADRTVVVRRAVRAHASQIAALFGNIYRNSSHPFKSLADVERFLADARNVQVVAEHRDRVIASAAMAYTPWNRSYELGRAITDPNFQRAGLAGDLLQAVVDLAAESGLGQVYIGFPRRQRIVDLCDQLRPKMIVVGHDGGKNVTSAGRETHLIVYGMPAGSSGIHAAPHGFAEHTALRELFYEPLGVLPDQRPYPSDAIVGPVGERTREREGFLFDRDVRCPSRSVDVVGSSIDDPATLCRRLDRLTSLLNAVHWTITILADKLFVLDGLMRRGFRAVAYLPAWYRSGEYRYDCIRLVKRTFTESAAVHDMGVEFTRVQQRLQSLAACGAEAPR